jgi:hypothetical protein
MSLYYTSINNDFFVASRSVFRCNHPMYSFIAPTGELVKTKTIKQFADQYGFRYSNARSLSCGYYKTLKGWCSPSPTARRARKRFQTVLVNPFLGIREVLGQRVTSFAERHHLCKSELYKLINGRQIGYRGWFSERTLKRMRHTKPRQPTVDN